MRNNNIVLLVLVLGVVGASVGVIYSEGHGNNNNNEKKKLVGYDYYELKCANVESIVKEELIPIFLTDPTAPPSLLRLLFHDCQVQGCDASILLDSNEFAITSEMESSKNIGIKQRETIGRLKSIVEMECPGQVSCADIIALAARESVSFTGGPFIHTPLGRKDSNTCSYPRADALLPSPTITVDELLNIFVAKGMNLEESVAILGAHTLGVGHCINIVDRLYNPKPNDWIDYSFEAQLKLNCPQIRSPFTNFTLLPNDITPFTFDNQYFRDILLGRGLFGIDSSISRDPRTAFIVRQFAANLNYFFDVFSSAFVKLSLTNVLTEGEGEVRKQCNQVN